jgi:hypothetical protein
MNPITDIGIIDNFAYPIIIAGYYLLVIMGTLDGYFRELIGHGHGSHSKLHRVLWQYHTGLPVDTQRSHGDERRLKRVAGASTRATPEGAIVYFTNLKRWQRGFRNNAFVLIFWAIIYGFFVNGQLTLQVVVVAIILGIALGIGLKVRKMRAKAAERPKKLEAINFKNLRIRPGATPVDKVVVPQFQAAGELVSEKPTLDAGIPISVMSTLLAHPLGISAKECAQLLAIGADKGTLRLPDTFASLPKQRETVEDIIRAQTRGTISFSWRTHEVPRQVTWVPVVNKLPNMVPFRQHLDQMEALPIGSFGVGYTAQNKMYITSHNGDTPWHLRSADSGTGKSTGFQVKLAQICHQDPGALVYCIDTKQVSFRDMHGIPGVTVFDNPVSQMSKIWEVFYKIESTMRDRYTAVREGSATYEEFENIWLLVDEGNDLATNLKLFYDKTVRKPNGPNGPTVWPEAILSIINLGRQVGIRGEWMFQNMTDKALGGVSLRDSWGVIGMAGYNKNQWSRIIGTTPMPEPKNGPGRIMMVHRNDQTWVQGFYDDPAYLRNYAMARR